MMRRNAGSALVALTILLGLPIGLPARAGEPTTVVFSFTPTARSQIALWVEDAGGRFLRTVRVTQAVSYRGIGNRPGASQMNSGFRWPYGRREGALPVWGHRRAAAPGAEPFRLIIFQDRIAEGHASRSSNDQSPESYYCLSFSAETTRKNALDAVSCASAFNSDKGRYIDDADVTRGYGEPAEIDGAPMMAPLPLTSLYPPRRDVTRCTGTSQCYDHADVALFAQDARRVMPDIDAVTMATPVGDREQTIMFSVPDDWAAGDYVAWLEVNVEGDYNAAFNDKTYPTPTGPDGRWDSWAITYGYPFRGQPSVVYRVPFRVGASAAFQARDPDGYGSLSGQGADGGRMHAMDGLVSNDPVGAPGSGADRLRLGGRDHRFRVEVRGAEFCAGNVAPGPVEGLTVAPVADKKHSHEWGHMSFVVPYDDGGVARFEARVSPDPIVDEASYMRALPASAAAIDSMELVIPVGGQPGARVDVDFGGMLPSSRYFVGVRPVDACNVPGPLAVAEITTTKIHFTQLSGCFVATAAFGGGLERRLDGLRQARDRLLGSAPGAALVAAYYRNGPRLAETVAGDPTLRAAVRSALGPLAAIADSLR